MVRKVDHSELEQLIDFFYNSNEALMVKGAPGIGKSVVVQEKAKEFADEESREFVNWEQAGKAEKKEVMDNVEDYFVYLDIRLAEYDPSDIKGIPDLEGETVEWKPPLWIKMICQEGAKGLVFLDECNLAPPTVQKAFYQLVLDRKLSQWSLSDGVWLMGAGNRAGKDRANIHEMPGPLKDRFGTVELIRPEGGMEEDEEGWVSWAVEHDLENRVIEYIASQHGRQNLFNFNEDAKEDADVFATPRSWEKASNTIQAQDGDLTKDEMELIVATEVGEDVAVEFRAFLDVRDKVDPNRFLEEPEKFSKELDSVDEKESVVTAIAGMYEQDPSILCDIVNVAHTLDEVNEDEFGFLLLRMTKEYNKDHFVENVSNCDQWEAVAEAYRKFIM